MTLSRLETTVKAAFVLVGTALTLYIGFTTFGFISNSKVHYANFVLAILVMSAIYGAQVLIEEIGKAGRMSARLWLRLSILVIGAICAVGGAGYVRIHAIRLDQIHPFFEDFDFYVGMVFLAGVLLLNWFHWGLLLTSLVAITIVYFFFGDRVPIPLLMLPEYDPKFVMNYMGLGLAEGMFWFARVAADNIYFLIIYASILLGVGMLKLVIEVGKVAGNHVRGGAAFPAIIGSGIVASVMGQAVANVVLTGRLTIPMMKDRGFRPNMAGAIEAVASTSGQIMPPVLGLAGFIIAVFLNVPYMDVALAGLIPALLFLSGVTIGVLAEALRSELPTLNEHIDRTVITRLLPPFLISFGVVLTLLLGYYSPSYAGLLGIVAALGACLFQGKHRPTRKELFNAFKDGLMLITLLSLLLIAVGPLAQTFQTTNLAQRLGVLLSQIVPDNTFLMLSGAMVISLLLGMGLPTPVAYLVVALSLVPFIQGAGVDPLVAHFFVFYFAVFSTLTPPVAVSALAAAKLSGGTFVGTAIDAMKLMLTTFIIPFAFCYHPQLLRFPNIGWDVLPPLLLVVFLQATTSAACYGYLFVKLTQMDRWLALALTVGGLVLLINWSQTSLALFAALLAMTLIRVAMLRRRAAAAEA
ncbi:MAG: TRAP transporter permease [Methyloligellaceae bacterium]